MKRNKMIEKLFDYDFDKGIVLEPNCRYKDVENFVFEMINMQMPKEILKIGVGSGKLLSEIAKTFDIRLYVVEPSFDVIKKFKNKYSNITGFDKIKFINGDIENLPIDFYKFGFLINLDNLDLIQSGFAIREFKRVVSVGGFLLIGTTLLNDEDFDGVYDDFTRTVLNLHNDYYLLEDLKTFLGLNSFNFVKGQQKNYLVDLEEKISLNSIFEENLENERKDFIDKNYQDLLNYYNFENNKVLEPYLLSIFKKVEPKKENEI